jgi:hypothetical protein
MAAARSPRARKTSRSGSRPGFWARASNVARSIDAIYRADERLDPCGRF